MKFQISHEAENQMKKVENLHEKYSENSLTTHFMTDFQNLMTDLLFSKIDGFP